MKNRWIPVAALFALLGATSSVAVGADATAEVLCIAARGAGGADIAVAGRQLGTNPAGLAAASRPGLVAETLVYEIDEDDADGVRVDGSILFNLPGNRGAVEMQVATRRHDTDRPVRGEEDDTLLRLRFGGNLSECLAWGLSASYTNVDARPEPDAEVDRDHYGVELGLRWQPRETVAVGLVAGYEGQSWDGDWDRSCFDGPFPLSTLSLSGDEDANRAYRVGGGIALTPRDDLTLACDLRYTREENDRQYNVRYDSARILDLDRIDEEIDLLSFRLGVEKRIPLAGGCDEGCVEHRLALRAGYRLDTREEEGVASVDETRHTGTVGLGVLLGAFRADLAAEVAEDDAWAAGAGLGISF